MSKDMDAKPPAYGLTSKAAGLHIDSKLAASSHLSSRHWAKAFLTTVILDSLRPPCWMATFASTHRKSTLNRQLSRIASVGVLFTCFASSAFAEYAAIAYGDENAAWGWARKTDQKSANAEAIAGCMKSSKAKDCKLDKTVALAEAHGSRRMGWGRSSKSLDEAKKLALTECGHADCKVTFSTTSPGFYSLAKSKDNEGKDGVFYLYYESINSDQSDKDAIRTCEERAGRDCSVVWSGAIAGKIAVSSPSAKSTTPVPSAKNCRPTTQPLHCTSQCTNGNCTITYENGCKMNVQVQPSFDPFSSQWKYPSPSC